ncbi:hypothetical protein AYO44_12585 [Planctomycetaceae bacterium SCGC AG-212-F19]|nr:hypothetical protein AYO44_12585 [Planctomycetaceae bacterium SCGC AG-212-F19]
MTDHTWVLEHIASYNAGGLEPAERFRFEAHLATCPECTRALEASQHFDRTLDDLFARARPKPGLEDRAIRRLRTAARPGLLRGPWARVLVSAAAVLFVGFVGASMNAAVSGGMSFPGQPRGAANPLGSLFAFTDVAAEKAISDPEARWSVDGKQSTILTLADTSASMVEGEDQTKTPARNYKSVEELAGEAKYRAQAVLSGKEQREGRREATRGDRNLENDEVGRDAVDPAPVLSLPGDGRSRDRGKINRPADKPTNYNVDRIEETSVPGPVNPNERTGIMNVPPAPPTTIPPPPGFGGQQGQGGGIGGFGDNKEGRQPRTPQQDSAGGKNAGPGNFGFAQPGRSGATRDGAEDAKKLPPPPKPSDVYYTFQNSADPKTPAISTITAGTEPAKETLESKAEAIKKAVNGQTALDRNQQLLRKMVEGELKRNELEKDKKGGEGKDGDKKPDPDSTAKGEPAPAEPAKPADPAPAKPAPKDPPAEEPPVTQRKVIRSGDTEFEVDSFESSVERIRKIVAEERGFVATENSDKLPNGKVKGTVVVRIPPDNLDRFILKLRGLGDLKSSHIGSQDVTKQYFDIESRLRAARAMEGRLIEIIKKGTGEIKDLLQAEKELGVWRTKIEEFEGEIRYYNNLISMSTLNIHLLEREIRGAFAATETERIDMGIEVDDVEKAQQDAHVVIAEAKGRIGKSELKQLPGGMSQAVLHFEVDPKNAGTLRDRLKQLGVVTRLEVGRAQQVEGGVGQAPQQNVKRYDVQFTVSLYNIAAVMPREAVHLTLVTPDTAVAYQAILARVSKSTASRLVSSPLDQQRGDQTTASVSFEIRMGDAEAVLTDVKALGEVMRLTVNETPDGPTVTRSKRGFHVTLAPLATVKPRETTIVQLASRNVAESYHTLQEVVNAAKGRMLDSQLNETDKHNVTGKVDFEVRRGDEATVLKAITGAGEMLSRNVVRAQDSENVIDTKVRLQVSLVNIANTRPRETVFLRLATRDVGESYRTLHEALGKLDGWVINAQLNEADQRNIIGDLIFEVRRPDEPAATKALAAAGELLMRRVDRVQDATDVVDSKVRLQVRLISVNHTMARETVAMNVATRDVTKSYRALQETIAKAKGWVVNARLDEADRKNITGDLLFEVRRSDEAAVLQELGKQGDVLNRNVTRAPDGADVVDTKVRLNVKLLNLENIPPRETFTLGIEVVDVDRTAAAMLAAVAEQKGRSHGAHVNLERDGRKTINIFFDVPLSAAQTVVTKFRNAGVVRTERAEQNQQVPDSELAVARLQVVLANASPIVGNDEGLGNSMKTALGYSFRGFAWSVAWIGSGLLFLAPWTALAGGLWLATSVVRRNRRKVDPSLPKQDDAGDKTTDVPAV